jgi:hypothetical protein
MRGLFDHWVFAWKVFLVPDETVVPRFANDVFAVKFAESVGPFLASFVELFE